jgi:hypothetical protein
MKSAYSYFHGFDRVLISCVVCIIQIVKIYTLMAVDPYSVYQKIYWPYLKKRVSKKLVGLLQVNICDWGYYFLGYKYFI